MISNLDKEALTAMNRREEKAYTESMKISCSAD
jgi:hypothetical protein